MAIPTSRVRRHQMATIEAAMHSVLAVKEISARVPNFTMGEVVQRLCCDFDMGRATAFRYVRRAIDVLGIHYDPNDEQRRVRIIQRRARH